MIFWRLWLSLFDRFEFIFFPCPVQQWDKQNWHLSASLCQTVVCLYFVSMLPKKPPVPLLILLLRIYFINEYLTLLLGNPQTDQQWQGRKTAARQGKKRKEKKKTTPQQYKKEMTLKQIRNKLPTHTHLPLWTHRVVYSYLCTLILVNIIQHDSDKHIQTTTQAATINRICLLAPPCIFRSVCLCNVCMFKSAGTA